MLKRRLVVSGWRLKWASSPSVATSFTNAMLGKALRDVYVDGFFKRVEDIRDFNTAAKERRYE